MKITSEMVESFNEILQDHESIIRIYKSEHNKYSYEIKPMEDKFIKNSSLVYPTDEFYNLLTGYFTGSHGIPLIFNNTGTTFWTNHLD